MSLKLSSAFRFPIWIGQIFTSAKSFEANPIIGSATLNRCGLHLGRVLLAQVVTQWRWLFLTGLLTRSERRQFRKLGFLMIPDFLPAGEFARLRQEIVQFPGDLRRMVQGDTQTYQGLIDAETSESMPTTRKLLSDKYFLSLMMYCGNVLKHPMFFSHCVKNGTHAAEADPQKSFHSDTFHPTMKAWLFLDDVDETNGPFVYVPGSHRPSVRRLSWEYRNSVKGPELENRYARRGSLRISADELRNLGFEEPITFNVPANTLIIADTMGFHRRGDAAANSSRLALYAYSRSNPFNPFPGLFPRWRARLEQRATRRALLRSDADAAKRGARPSWQTVSNRALRENESS